MNKFGIILVIFAVLLVALGNLNVTVTLSPPRNYSHSDYPGKCFICDGLILEPGKHTHPNDPCIKLICKEDGSGTIETTSPAGCDPEYVKREQLSLPDGIGV